MKNTAQHERKKLYTCEPILQLQHDMRTPLNVILGYAQLLGCDRTMNLTDAQINKIQGIITACRKLNGILDESISTCVHGTAREIENPEVGEPGEKD
ncbi:hypothetical protein BHU72_04415 [Desulfuribacillus stibiiarsenatis]|uniref:histidine kinase n=1 Tax=Desulfuribacillus stibiiarsenatis TaxID=1390249 RepID=A0A1E5L5Q7_9FIRM|nr:histidine kinase dimerization/phospho-acceptor domain-containing protein [Desulfuribacillus stibiiarsenatis]OEH85343.1 hypothetical protein BHU72_04415 [Desulfuribacillus stibiiarsenatis]